jgi:16S rRNA U516 pseudouridylate synthase RsuA-like enzyme
MCEQAGVQVLTLRRIQEGNVKLGNLPLRQWRDLTEAEISALQR